MNEKLNELKIDRLNQSLAVNSLNEEENKKPKDIIEKKQKNRSKKFALPTEDSDSDKKIQQKSTNKKGKLADKVLHFSGDKKKIMKKLTLTYNDNTPDLDLEASFDLKKKKRFFLAD